MPFGCASLLLSHNKKWAKRKKKLTVHRNVFLNRYNVTGIFEHWQSFVLFKNNDHLCTHTLSKFHVDFIPINPLTESRVKTDFNIVVSRFNYSNYVLFLNRFRGVVIHIRYNNFNRRSYYIYSITDLDIYMYIFGTCLLKIEHCILLGCHLINVTKKDKNVRFFLEKALLTNGNLDKILDNGSIKQDIFSRQN
ncbi:hypothetical protein T01_3015 [Trichinella spiralis]|uniref:Uncharacterized protein n=1 Tax=Trichinella spiralis TaxID=6334 RepID=A0A0V1BP07_TRISP|nr:hypothetical protein T01_3015 [Trichinella spiralis]